MHLNKYFSTPRYSTILFPRGTLTTAYLVRAKTDFKFLFLRSKNLIYGIFCFALFIKYIPVVRTNNTVQIAALAYACSTAWMDGMTESISRQNT